MVKYPKPKRLKRTMLRGVRPFRGLTPPPNLRPETISRMRKLLFEEVLVNGKTRAELNDRQRFVADHAHLVVLFHLGEKTFQDLQRNKEKGHRVAFDQEQIGSLNFLILEEREKGQLRAVLEKLEGKVRVEK